MDEGARLPEEHERNAGHGDRDLFQVTYRELNWESLVEVLTAAELYWFFCDAVNQEDISCLKEFEGPGGAKVQMIEAEARLYGYKTAGARVQLAFVNEMLTGLLIYSVVFERIVAVRCLYVEPWSQRLKLAKGLINSLQPTPQKLVFQSRKEVPPERLLAITQGRRTTIDENEHFFTYAMEWLNGP